MARRIARCNHQHRSDRLCITVRPTSQPDWHFSPARCNLFGRAPKNAHVFGQGIYLAPLEAAWMSCDERYAEKDSCGIQHVLLRDFAQGKPELVQKGSVQFTPTAGSDHTTAVDNLLRPLRYIVWSTDMNQRILPKYAVSFSLS